LCLKRASLLALGVVDGLHSFLKVINVFFERRKNLVQALFVLMGKKLSLFLKDSVCKIFKCLAKSLFGFANGFKSLAQACKLKLKRMLGLAYGRGRVLFRLLKAVPPAQKSAQ
jgi:hypothetical protein